MEGGMEGGRMGSNGELYHDISYATCVVYYN